MKRWAAPLLTVLLVAFAAVPWPDAYPRASLPALLVEHLTLVITSSLASAVVGVGAALVLTRPRARFLLPLGERAAALAQTFPPAAVLALAIPLVGFGFVPTLLGLFLFATLPIFRAALTGLEQVPAAVLDAADGLGFGRSRRLWEVEVPLAWPYLWAGLRTSVVVNVGTATLGATVGAGGLGAPIVSGLVTQNATYLWEGSVAAGLLALTVDAWFGWGERKWRA